LHLRAGRCPIAHHASNLCDRIASARNIEVRTNTEVTGLEGDGCLEAVTLTSRVTGEAETIRTRWLFVCIGGTPHRVSADGS
jgi:thioredoxin reductase (NADPH)